MAQGIFNSLLDAILALVAPQSLSGSAVLQRATQAAKFQELDARISQVQAGDIILTRTPGTFYGCFRKMAGQTYDHLAIVMDSQQFLHVGPPRIRLLPVPLLLSDARSPLIVRPDLSPQQRKHLLAELSGMVGAPYDVARVYKFTFALSMCKLGHQPSPTNLPLNAETPLCGRCFTIDCKCPPSEPSEHGSGLCSCASSYGKSNLRLKGAGEERKEHGSGQCGCSLQPRVELGYRICTDAIMNRLMETSPKHREEALSIWPFLDVARHNSWSLNDVETLMRMFPGSLPQIGLAKLHKKDVAKRYVSADAEEVELWRTKLLSYCLMVVMVVSPLHIGLRTAFAAAALGRVVVSKL